jgi:predicted  nucleic acid-binding Zn-ribbon protein
MNIEQVKKIKTKEEARQLAIDWQNWASNKALSYEELNEWQNEFERLGQEFNLIEEFKENGII